MQVRLAHILRNQRATGIRYYTMLYYGVQDCLLSFDVARGPFLLRERFGTSTLVCPCRFKSRKLAQQENRVVNKDFTKGAHCEDI
eukprot:1955798-Amphidinium_carterae.1